MEINAAKDHGNRLAKTMEINAVKDHGNRFSQDHGNQCSNSPSVGHWVSIGCCQAYR